MEDLFLDPTAHSGATPAPHRQPMSRPVACSFAEDASVDLYGDLSMSSLQSDFSQNSPQKHVGIDFSKVREAVNQAKGDTSTVASCPPSSGTADLDLYTEHIRSEVTLREKLKSVESLNAELSSEVTLLKTHKDQLLKNISSLLLTAKKEIGEKEAEIAKLRAIIESQNSASVSSKECATCKSKRGQSRNKTIEGHSNLDSVPRERSNSWSLKEKNRTETIKKDDRGDRRREDMVKRDERDRRKGDHHAKNDASHAADRKRDATKGSDHRRSESRKRDDKSNHDNHHLSETKKADQTASSKSHQRSEDKRKREVPSSNPYVPSSRPSTSGASVSPPRRKNSAEDTRVSASASNTEQTEDLRNKLKRKRENVNNTSKESGKESKRPKVDFSEPNVNNSGHISEDMSTLKEGPSRIVPKLIQRYASTSKDASLEGKCTAELEAMKDALQKKLAQDFSLDVKTVNKDDKRDSSVKNKAISHGPEYMKEKDTTDLRFLIKNRQLQESVRKSKSATKDDEKRINDVLSFVKKQEVSSKSDSVLIDGQTSGNRKAEFGETNLSDSVLKPEEKGAAFLKSASSLKNLPDEASTSKHSWKEPLENVAVRCKSKTDIQPGAQTCEQGVCALQTTHRIDASAHQSQIVSGKGDLSTAVGDALRSQGEDGQQAKLSASKPKKDFTFLAPEISCQESNSVASNVSMPFVNMKFVEGNSVTNQTWPFEATDSIQTNQNSNADFQLPVKKTDNQPVKASPQRKNDNSNNNYAVLNGTRSFPISSMTAEREQETRFENLKAESLKCSMEEDSSRDSAGSASKSSHGSVDTASKDSRSSCTDAQNVGSASSESRQSDSASLMESLRSSDSVANKPGESSSKDSAASESCSKGEGVDLDRSSDTSSSSETLKTPCKKKPGGGVFIPCTSNLIMLGDEETTCTTFASPNKHVALPSEFYPPGVRGTINEGGSHYRHIRGEDEAVFHPIHAAMNKETEVKTLKALFKGEKNLIREASDAIVFAKPFSSVENKDEETNSSKATLAEPDENLNLVSEKSSEPCAVVQLASTLKVLESKDAPEAMIQTADSKKVQRDGILIVSDETSTQTCESEKVALSLPQCNEAKSDRLTGEASLAQVAHQTSIKVDKPSPKTLAWETLFQSTFADVFGESHTEFEQKCANAREKGLAARLRLKEELTKLRNAVLESAECSQFATDISNLKSDTNAEVCKPRPATTMHSTSSLQPGDPTHPPVRAHPHSAEAPDTGVLQLQKTEPSPSTEQPLLESTAGRHHNLEEHSYTSRRLTCEGDPQALSQLPTAKLSQQNVLLKAGGKIPQRNSSSILKSCTNNGSSPPAPAAKKDGEHSNTSDSKAKCLPSKFVGIKQNISCVWRASPDSCMVTSSDASKRAYSMSPDERLRQNTPDLSTRREPDSTSDTHGSAEQADPARDFCNEQTDKSFEKIPLVPAVGEGGGLCDKSSSADLGQGKTAHLVSPVGAYSPATPGKIHPALRPTAVIGHAMDETSQFLSPDKFVRHFRKFSEPNTDAELISTDHSEADDLDKTLVNQSFHMDGEENGLSPQGAERLLHFDEEVSLSAASLSEFDKDLGQSTPRHFAPQRLDVFETSLQHASSSKRARRMKIQKSPSKSPGGAETLTNRPAVHGVGSPAPNRDSRSIPYQNIHKNTDPGCHKDFTLAKHTREVSDKVNSCQKKVFSPSKFSSQTQPHSPQRQSVAGDLQHYEMSLTEEDEDIVVDCESDASENDETLSRLLTFQDLQKMGIVSQRSEETGQGESPHAADGPVSEANSPHELGENNVDTEQCAESLKFLESVNKVRKNLNLDFDTERRGSESKDDQSPSIHTFSPASVKTLTSDLYLSDSESDGFPSPVKKAKHSAPLRSNQAATSCEQTQASSVSQGTVHRIEKSDDSENKPQSTAFDSEPNHRFDHASMSCSQSEEVEAENEELEEGEIEDDEDSRTDNMAEERSKKGGDPKVFLKRNVKDRLGVKGQTRGDRANRSGRDLVSTSRMDRRNGTETKHCQDMERCDRQKHSRTRSDGPGARKEGRLISRLSCERRDGEGRERRETQPRQSQARSGSERANPRQASSRHKHRDHHASNTKQNSRNTHMEERHTSKNSLEKERERSRKFHDEEKQRSRSSNDRERPRSRSSNDRERPRSGNSNDRDRPRSRNSNDRERSGNSNDRERPRSRNSNDRERPRSRNSNDRERPRSRNSNDRERSGSRNSFEDRPSSRSSCDEV